MTLSLGWIDLIVLLSSLAVVVLIGITVSGRNRTLEGYLLGDRDLPWWAILGSIVATETSTATVLSVPGLGFGATGFTFLQLTVGYVIGRAVVARVLLPRYFEGRLSTAYEVLGARFGRRMTRVASSLFLVARNLGDGLRLYLAALVLQQLAGWSFGTSAVAMGAVTIVYTYVGGMRSVVWNDCLQFIIYMVGAVAALFVIANHLPGGWGEVFAFADAHDKWRVIDVRWSWSRPYTLWAGLIGGAMLTLGTHGTDQMMVQRYLSARSLPDARRALIASGFVVFVQFAVFLFIGMELAAFYSHRPEVTFARTDAIFSHFIVHEFPRNVGLIGLMLAAILAAAMSTLSSSLNSSASALINDFYLPARRTPLSDQAAVAVTRRTTVLFGVLQVGIAWWATKLTSTVVDSALTIAGFVAGLLLGLYGLGILTRRVTCGQALWGAAVGGSMLLFVQFGAPAVGWPRIAFPWLALVGSTTTFAAGWVASRTRA